MKKPIQKFLNGGKKFINFMPLLLLLPVAVYAFSDQSGKDTITSWMMQTPAKSLVTRGFDYYPNFLNESDVVVYHKTFYDQNGKEYTGAVIEVRRPTVFASPANTGSMQPILGSGNLLVQEIVDEHTKLQVGDIVVYEYNGDLVIHQIVDKTGDCYVTKGSNNAAPDPVCITQDKVRYRLLFSIPTK